MKLRIALLAVTALAALAATSATASAAPSVTITPGTTDLVNGQTVTVEGTDFEPVTALPPPVPRDGLYVAQAASVAGTWVVGDSQRWISYTNEDPETKLSPEGEFTTTIQVSRFLGGGTVDCLNVECVILTWQAHGNPGGPFNPIFTQTPITFGEYFLLVDPRQGLSPTETTTVNVSGAKYRPDWFPNGIKIAQAQANGNSFAYGPTITVTTTADPENPDEALLTAEGYFSARVSVAAKRTVTGGQIDCEFRSCQIIAWPADEEPTGGQDGNIIASEDIGFAFEYNPVLKLSKSRKLPSEATVDVAGSGFPGGPPGLYVAQAARIDGEWLTAVRDTSGTAANMKFLMPNSPVPDMRLNPDGSFETAIKVVRNFKLENGNTVDCAVVDCYVITWRAHTNPGRNTVYTSSPIVFNDAATRVRAVGKPRIQLGRKARSVAVAAVVCGADPCTVRSPKRAVVRVGGKRYGLPVVARRKVGAGRNAVVKLIVPGRVARALVGGNARVAFQLRVTSASADVKVRVAKSLVGAKR